MQIDDDDAVRDERVVRPRAVGDERHPPRPDASIEDTVIRTPRTAEPWAVVEDTVIRGGAPAAAAEVPAAELPAAEVPAAEVPAADPRSVAPGSERVASVRIGADLHRLDRPVVVGRAPRGARIPVPGQVGPALVTVASRTGQVSGSHVAIRSEGGAVVVEDLRSTNGTVVRMPGSAPQRLPAGASIVVLTGTVVEIGDGNVIEVLSPHLRPAPVPPIPRSPSERDPLS